MLSTLKMAEELFKTERYNEAYCLYHQLGRKYGYKNFSANIVLCKRRMLRSKFADSEIIVSLTSYGQRIKTVHNVITSLLHQTFPDFSIALWLAKNEQEKELPSKLVSLICEKFQIFWVEEDLKSYKKLIYSLQEFTDKIIVTADDDIIYQEDWLESLYREHIKYPDNIIAHRCHKILLDQDGNFLPYKQWKHRTRIYSRSFFNFTTCGGGALFPPHSLHQDVLLQNIFTLYAPRADDVWFWSMMVRNKRQIIVPHNCQASLKYVEGTQEASSNGENIPLWILNVTQGGNDTQLNSVCTLYPEIKEICLSQKNEIDIAFITDEHYLWITLVAISSLIENKFSDTIYNIYIISVSISKINREMVSMIEKRLGIKLNIIIVGTDNINGLHKGHNEYTTATETALIKFMIPRVLSKLERVLYIDSDVYIQKDLSELAMFEFNDKPVAAVLDSGTMYSNRTKVYSDKYFNSGVMLLNLDMMRKGEYSEKLFYQKKTLSDNSLMDQHVFNIVFKGNFHQLPIRYNFLYTNLVRSSHKYTMDTLNKMYNTNYIHLNQVIDDASIIHFASHDKPWLYDNVPFSHIWLDMYYKSGVYKYMGLERTQNNSWDDKYFVI